MPNWKDIETTTRLVAPRSDEFCLTREDLASLIDIVDNILHYNAKRSASQKSFKVGQVQCHCGQCKYAEFPKIAGPCSICLAEGNGEFFDPENPEYFEKIKTLIDKYSARVRELNLSSESLRDEISRDAEKLGVNVSDFDFACKETQ